MDKEGWERDLQTVPLPGPADPRSGRIYNATVWPPAQPKGALADTAAFPRIHTDRGMVEADTDTASPAAFPRVVEEGAER